MDNISELEPFCGSWIIVCRETEKPVFETFNRKIAESVNQDRYKVITSYQYLVSLNKKIKAENRL